MKARISTHSTQKEKEPESQSGQEWQHHSTLGAELGQGISSEARGWLVNEF